MCVCVCVCVCVQHVMHLLFIAVSDMIAEFFTRRNFASRFIKVTQLCQSIAFCALASQCDYTFYCGGGEL